VNRRPATTAFAATGIEREEAVCERRSVDGRSDSSNPDDDQQRTMRAFEVTVLTTRSGMGVVVVAAADRETALSTAREELANGDFTVPTEQCTDDVHTEIWTIRELH
jgi:hypothetical protein